MQFYTALILSFVLTIIPAVVNFLKEDSVKLKWWGIYPALLGALLSLFTGYSAHNEALRNGDTAHVNDSLYKDLLNQNLKSAKKKSSIL